MCLSGSQFPNQGSNPCHLPMPLTQALHPCSLQGNAESQPLDHQESLFFFFWSSFSTPHYLNQLRLSPESLPQDRGGLGCEESSCNEGDLGLITGLGRFPGRGHDNPLQYSCMENSHGQRSLAGYGPWGCKESDTNEATQHIAHSSSIQDREGLSSIQPVLVDQVASSPPISHSITCVLSLYSVAMCGAIDSFFVISCIF